MRGLSEKNGHYYGQFNIQGKVIQLPLHDAATVPDAETARQAIKKKIADGTLDIAVARKVSPPLRDENPPPPGAPVNESGESAIAAKASTPATGSKGPLSVAIAAYQRSRDLLDKKDVNTCKREDSGLRLWSENLASFPLSRYPALRS
jgi:hypothetical protein